MAHGAGLVKIIIGLGNPGSRYAGTFHNVGFDAVDLLAERWSGSWRESARERAWIAEVRIGSEKVVLSKPATFMNLSGESVRETLRNRPAELSDLLVISDEVHLEIGRLRIRPGGSHGGQNGLRSIINCLGSEEFPRLRIGIRSTRPIDDMAQYVLGRPRPEEAVRLREMIERAADAAEEFVAGGAEAAANKFNGPPVRKGE